LDEHLAAGADHVCVQLLGADDADPLPGLRLSTGTAFRANCALAQSDASHAVQLGTSG